MKKTMTAFLALIMLISFSACGWKVEIVNPNEIIENDTEISVSEPEKSDNNEYYDEVLEAPENPVKGEEDKAVSDDFEFSEGTKAINVITPAYVKKEITLVLPQDTVYEDGGDNLTAVFSDGSRLLAGWVFVHKLEETTRADDTLYYYRNPEESLGYISHEKVVCGEYEGIRIIRSAGFSGDKNAAEVPENEKFHIYEYFIKVNETEILSMSFYAKGSDNIKAMELQEKIAANVKIGKPVLSCVSNGTGHEENLSFKMELPGDWNFTDLTTAYFNGSKVAECYMKCDKSYDDWLKEKNDEYIKKEISGKTFYVLSYEQPMLNYNDENGDFKEMNKYEISEYEFHNGTHEYRFVLFENKDKGEEYTEKFEMALETFAPAEDYITIEDGKVFGMVCPFADTVINNGGIVLEDELVSVSMSVPEGWTAETMKYNGNIIGINFKMPWSDVLETSFMIYKENNLGMVYDYLYNKFSWGLKIDDDTFNEITGNFTKGVYIRIDDPNKNLGDNENWSRASQWIYLMQFDGYVAVAHQNVRLNENGEPFKEHEKACSEFASSIKIG